MNPLHWNRWLCLLCYQCYKQMSFLDTYLMKVGRCYANSRAEDYSTFKPPRSVTFYKLPGSVERRLRIVDSISALHSSHYFTITILCFQSNPTSYLSRLMTKPTKLHVRPAKTRISLGIRPVWSVFAVRMKNAWVLIYPLSAQRRSDQTGRMPRLIWVFAGRTVILLVLSWGGSIVSLTWSVFVYCIQLQR